MAENPSASKKRLVACDPRALGTQTNIDRRKCHRVVPMKVIGLGLSRTGTSSLRQALIDSGCEDCYHYASIFNENPRDAEMWTEALLAKHERKGKPFIRSDWDQLLGHCLAITDTPCMASWRELLEAYPDAKCILTIRDLTEHWYASQMSTIVPYFSAFFGPIDLAGRIYRTLLPETAHGRMTALLHKHYMYKDLETNGKCFYEEHNAEVMRTVTGENLLVFNVKEDSVQCDFLSVGRPSFPFPIVNDREVFQENGRKLGAILNYIEAINAAKLLGVFGLSLAIFWYVLV